MEINIPYGSGSCRATLPDDTALLATREPERKLSPESFARALRRHLDFASLDLSETVIVIADKTRVCGYPSHLPVLVETLKEFGLREDSLRFIIAYGTHPRQSDEECRHNYGDISTRYPFLHHDCTDLNLFRDCGRTPHGTPIRLRKDILDASCVITMGPICHHYFAGYGGGRKLIFPGCGEREAIYANHGLYLDREARRLAPTCQPGILAGNPLAEDLFDIAEAREADLALHGIMDSHGNLCDIIIGQGRTSYLEACRIHGDLCESSFAAGPTVVASCGGYPKDINFIQSHKAIHNAAMFVEDGGTLYIFSQCRDGLGSRTFLPWYQMGDFEAAFEQLAANYEGNGGTALAMMSKTARIRIVMVTELADDVCHAIEVEKRSCSQAVEELARLEAPVIYIANGSLLVRKMGPVSANR